ncbi:MAG: protein-methionine-sulfoxide reductase catalytic subunit MsrP [Gammaproteobacteria bacterium]|nr:protein-methionine-sulfoxide reductase catalytic subunit MsrP [Gammaproteobacteria bacterium]
MLIQRPPDLKASEITPEAVYLQRRSLMKQALALLLTPSLSQAAGWFDKDEPPSSPQKPLRYSRWPHSLQGERTTEDAVTHYNNYYEFGLGKDEPAQNARGFQTEPWSVVIEGECAHPGRYTLEDVLKGMNLEERVYRLRCVEAWSMVVPWVGFPLAALLKRVEPGSRAKYIAFETLHDPERMPGQKPGLFGLSSLDWPYREGLRVDEAMHPLTLLAVGLYGKTLSPQNGAPLRLVVPWKYGFKSIKSIVRLRLQEEPPETTWSRSAPGEYGFYANVNPEVDHPRWSQAKERRILSGSLLGVERVGTLPFNGYAEQVAGLYAGMDLRRNF